MKVIRKKVVDLKRVDPDYDQIITAIKFIFYQLHAQNKGSYVAGKRARRAIRMVKRKLHERLMSSLQDMKIKQGEKSTEEFFYKQFEEELNSLMESSHESDEIDEE